MPSFKPDSCMCRLLSARFSRRLPAVAVAAIVLIYLINDLNTPLMSDDFQYGVYYPNRQGFIHTIGGMYLHTNARFGDLTSGLWLYLLPRPVTAVLCAGMFALMYAALLRLSDVRSLPALLQVIFIAASTMLLPFFDCSMLLVVQLNYIWAMALSGSVLWLIFTHPMQRRRWLWLAPVAAIAGFTHEIIGMPMLLGVAAWLRFCPHEQLSRAKRIIVAAIMVGGIISISSPGSYSRLLYVDTLATTSMASRLSGLQHGWLALLLIADILVLAVFKRDRLRGLCHTLWLPMAVIAVSSMIFLFVGGAGARSAWAVQFFALAALCRQMAPRLSRLRLKGVAATATALLVVVAMWVQAAFVMKWNTTLHREYNNCVELFLSNPSRPVVANVHFTDELPIYVRPFLKSMIESEWVQYVISGYGEPFVLVKTPQKAVDED